MPNNAPIFMNIPRAGWVTLTAANIAKDGTGIAPIILTADAASGAFVRSIIARSLGTNTGSVCRVFLNNGLTPATPANNTLIGEFGLPATIITETGGQPTPELPINEAIPPGHRLLVTLGTAVVAGWAITALGGGDY